MVQRTTQTDVPDLVTVRRALVSVSDKEGIVEICRELVRRGIEIISTGGTASALSNAGIQVRDVSSLTSFPEIMDGRVKTLHPAVHGGLLAVRSDPRHSAAMEEFGIAPIDLAIINLYPFEQVAASGAGEADTIENIDIGGPAMIRAAAKNHGFVTILTDPSDYQALVECLTEHKGATTLALRRRLARKAFERTAAYDAAISAWFRENSETAESPLPVHLTVGGRLSERLRYGENPHQAGALYLTGENRPGAARAKQLQGKQLSWNNINDTDAAFELASEFTAADGAAVVIVKHANPCGVAVAGSLAAAWERALACDPVSAFGGIVAVNRELDADTAAAIAGIFTEVIICPSASDRALEILASRKNVRLLTTGGMADPEQPGIQVRSVAGGLLVQSRDTGNVDRAALRSVTKRKPTAAEESDLRFAFRVAKHVKSNAIVYAKNGATVGIGAGQMSRVDSARTAARKAADAAEAAGMAEPLTLGSVVASDAFFPFADGLMTAIEAGATAVIQPGGSLRDEEIIAAADKAGIAMVFTGMRHFRH
jgi:phosphoribosylaminoimidazolecarboxamide formyltransferase / IMP cyclohydrolase